MNLSISAPWVTYHKQVYNLFKDDVEIDVDDTLSETESGNYEFTISSKNGDKLYAIERLLGYGTSFGNVKVNIKYGYENMEEVDWPSIWERAFSGNPLFQEVIRYDTPVLGKGGYAVFKKEIMSFYDDNLGDYCGNSHFIVADVVRDLCIGNNVHPCTANY